jgi:hypothetical protein
MMVYDINNMGVGVQIFIIYNLYICIIYMCSNIIYQKYFNKNFIIYIL